MGNPKTEKSKRNRRNRLAREKEKKNEETKARQYQKALRRGQASETKFFQAFRQSGLDLPEWFYGVRKGTHRDDSAGVDGFAVTDVGEIPLQLKSSVRGMYEFVARRPGSVCVILVVSPEMPDTTIIRKTLEFVGKRHAYLSREKQNRKGPSDAI